MLKSFENCMIPQKPQIKATTLSQKDNYINLRVLALVTES